MKKKIKYFKKCCSLFLFTSFISIFSIAIFNIEKSNDNQSITNSSTSKISTYTTNQYNTNTNWLNGATAPSNYQSFKPLAVNDGSFGIVTKYGYLGINNDNTTLYLTSFSGYVIWAMNPMQNQFVTNFYAQSNNGLDITNVKIQQWCYVESKDALVLLLGTNDYTNQTILALDIKSGLLYSPNLDSELNITTAPIAKLGNDAAGYERLYKLSNNNVLITKVGSKTDYQNSMKLTLNNQGISLNALNFSFNSTVVNDADILANVVAGNNVNFLFFISGSPTTSQSTEYEQYVIACTNSMALISGSKEGLNNRYIAESSDGNTTMNFGCVKTNENTQNLYLLTGNENKRYLNYLQYNSSSNTFNKISSVDLSGNVINTIAYDSKFNTIYIGNKSSFKNSLLGYIDLSSNNLQYVSIVNVSISSFAPVYAIPLKEYLQNPASQIVLYTTQSNTMSYVTKNTYTNKFNPSNASLPLYGWNYNNLYSQIKSLNLTTNNMQSSININTVKSKLIFTSGTPTPTLSYSQTSANTTNGTLSFNINVKYSWAFDSLLYSSFNIPINMNGFYKINDTNYSFQFITSSSQNSDKYQKIQELKQTKFAKDITVEDVYNNFWTGTINDKNFRQINITPSMFSVNGNFGNFDTLKVTFTLPSSNMPSGFPSGKLKVTQTYTGFLSTAGYDINVKSDDEINSIVSSIYPSQLTIGDILNEFIICGEKIFLDPKYWIYEIKDVDDFNGVATISLSYNYELADNIPNKTDFPTSIFTIFTDKQVTGFMKLSSSFLNVDSPFFDEFESTYLPSEIWNQYVYFLENKTTNSLLLENINFNLIQNKNDLLVDLLNDSTCDADGFLNTNIYIKNNAVLNIKYTGNQFLAQETNLLFSNELLEKINSFNPTFYPFNNIQFNIKTTSKFFDVIGPNGESITQSDNTYYINLNDYKDVENSILSSNEFANKVTQKDIINLVKSEGYNVELSSFNINNEKGYIIAKINISLSSPPLFPNKNLLNETIIPSNSVRTIIVYNFKIPKPAIINSLTIGVIVTSSIIGVVCITWLIIWYLRKIRFKKLAINKEIYDENNKMFLNLKNKYKMTKELENISKNNKKTKK